MDMCVTPRLGVIQILMGVPKGGIEKGETSGQAAVREAWEEGEYAGVRLIG